MGAERIQTCYAIVFYPLLDNRLAPWTAQGGKRFCYSVCYAKVFYIESVLVIYFIPAMITNMFFHRHLILLRLY
jgi:hypothetical protein